METEQSAWTVTVILTILFVKHVTKKQGNVTVWKRKDHFLTLKPAENVPKTMWVITVIQTK